jgi:hypothetical protein
MTVGFATYRPGDRLAGLPTYLALGTLAAGAVAFLVLHPRERDLRRIVDAHNARRPPVPLQWHVAATPLAGGAAAALVVTF